MGIRRRPPHGTEELLLPSLATLVAAEPGAVRLGIGHGCGGHRIVRTGCSGGVGVAGVAAGPRVVGVAAEHAGVGAAVIVDHWYLLHRCIWWMRCAPTGGRVSRRLRGRADQVSGVRWG